MFFFYCFVFIVLFVLFLCYVHQISVPMVEGAAPMLPPSFDTSFLSFSFRGSLYLFPCDVTNTKKAWYSGSNVAPPFFFCRLSNSFPSSVSPYGFRLGFVYWNSFRVGNALVIHHVPVLAIPINCMAWVAFVLRCSSCGPWTDSSLFIWQQSMSWLSS